LLGRPLVRWSPARRRTLTAVPRDSSFDVSRTHAHTIPATPNRGLRRRGDCLSSSTGNASELRKRPLVGTRSAPLPGFARLTGPKLFLCPGQRKQECP
jgi:hypothetical protein